MWETVLSGFEQRWGPWAGTTVETSFKIKGLGWRSCGDCWGIERTSDLEWQIGWVCCIAGGKGREEVEVVWPWTSAFSTCVVLIGSKEAIRKAHSQQMRAWVHQHGVSRSWRPHRRGEHSENRKVKRQEWNVTCSSDALLGYILTSRFVHCNILAKENVKYH